MTDKRSELAFAYRAALRSQHYNLMLQKEHDEERRESLEDRLTFSLDTVLRMLAPMLGRDADEADSTLNDIS